MRTRGFTLIELMVVSAIVLVGLSLFLPALQKARADARQDQCMNNLKQFGLALHNYHDTVLTFPPGWVSREGYVGAGPRFGWGSMILPFIDQAPLYKRLEFSKPMPANAGGKQLLQTALPVYRCPADSTPAVHPLRGEYGTSNYSGNFGFVPPPRWTALGLSDFWPGTADAPMVSTGIFARNSRVAIRDVKDGTSNTVLVSERCVSSAAAIWPGVTDNGHDDDVLTDMSHLSRINAGLSSYSSRHPGGANFLMCDGVVRFINEKIDSKADTLGTYQRLSGKNDRQVIGEF